MHGIGANQHLHRPRRGQTAGGRHTACIKARLARLWRVDAMQADARLADLKRIAINHPRAARYIGSSRHGTK
jgi:hypothetical protein